MLTVLIGVVSAFVLTLTVLLTVTKLKCCRSPHAMPAPTAAVTDRNDDNLSTADGNMSADGDTTPGVLINVAVMLWGCVLVWWRE